MGAALSTLTPGATLSGGKGMTASLSPLSKERAYVYTKGHGEFTVCLSNHLTACLRYSA